MVSESCPFTDLVAAHALGALDDDERAGLERHLADGCAVCEPELAAMTRVAEGIALSAPAVEPRAEVRRGVIERATAPVPLRSPGTVAATRRQPWAIAASIAALLLVGAVVWGMSLQQRLQREQRDRIALAADLTAARAELTRAQTQLTSGEVERAALLRHLSVLGASRLQQVQLAALPPAPSANARMFVDPGSGQAIFSASGLPALPNNRTYQLWFITNGKPVSAGIFDVTPQGNGRVLVQAAPPTGVIWAVTVEPAGGVPQPTGQMVLKS
ncbi:MAG TPA: anti-sigma factor [Thermoanaerobaculia bacterium]|jgi:anti-sigma-K factor RskA|nr:anti-sigma factor [Thermoanaerobaculia bacterium]